MLEYGLVWSGLVWKDDDIKGMDLKESEMGSERENGGPSLAVSTVTLHVTLCVSCWLVAVMSLVSIIFLLFRSLNLSPDGDFLSGSPHFSPSLTRFWTSSARRRHRRTSAPSFPSLFSLLSLLLPSHIPTFFHT